MGKKKLLTGEPNVLVTAWMYFTRCPLPGFIAQRVDFSQTTLEQSARYLSVIGIIVGAASGGVFWAADQVFSQPTSIILSIICSILLTGAFHEDGLADFFDAFGGGWWSKEKILEIMKDSRLGTFASLALICALFLKFTSLDELPASLIPISLIAGHALSRFMAASFIYTHEYVRENGQSHFKPSLKGRMSRRDLAILGVTGVLPTLLLGPLYLLLVPVLWIVRLYLGNLLTRRIGGYTGDCLGAVQQITELVFYLGVFVIYRFS